MANLDDLTHIVSEWSFWDAPPPSSIPRAILNQPLALEPDLVVAIQGVRRCGKSTLLTQIMTGRGLNPHHCFFVNFEDPRLSGRLHAGLLDQIADLGRLRAGEAETRYFFLDEIQNVNGWEKWLHVRVERPRNEVFVITGSNASLLAGELGSRLTGRHLAVELFPFSFSEFRRLRPAGDVDEFLQAGGFPRVLTFEQPERLLREYFTDIIERDVRRHVAARSATTLVHLARAVFESTGSELSQRKLASQLGISADTAGVYLSACMSAYLVEECGYFSYSERQRAARNRKYYPIDLGLYGAVVGRGGRDRGKRLETAVFHQLRRRFGRVSYWRGKNEVDFIVQEGASIIPFQVSWDGALERHHHGIEELKTAFPGVSEPVFISRQNVEAFLLESGPGAV